MTLIAVIDETLQLIVVKLVATLYGLLALIG